MEEKRGFTFDTPEGSVEMEIDEVIQLAERGDPDGLYALGMAYLFGWDIEADERAGYANLEKAVEKGHTDAMTLLVRMFMQGEYEGMDAVRAAELSIRAAKDNIPDAQLYAGLAYMDGISVGQDYAEAARMFRMAANQGNDEARTNLAYLFQEGLGVGKDEAKAFKMYRIAAKNGNVNAMFHMGICYEFGVGTKIDLAKASEWYMKGSDEKDPYATERLAHLVFEGYDGVEPDMEAGFELFVKAADMGIPGPMFTVGLCYLDGNGVEQDKDEARKWLKLASDSGIEEARPYLDSITD